MNSARIVEVSGSESLHEAKSITSEEEDAAVNRWRAGGYMTMAEALGLRGYSEDTNAGGLCRAKKWCLKPETGALQAQRIHAEG
jgi:hypothetical protein